MALILMRLPFVMTPKVIRMRKPPWKTSFALFLMMEERMKTWSMERGDLDVCVCRQIVIEVNNATLA